MTTVRTDAARSTGTGRLVPAAALVLVTAALVVVVCNPEAVPPGAAAYDVQWWNALAWGSFAAAVALLLRVPRGRAGTGLLVAGALLVGVAGLGAPPRFSDDSARYAWDGIVTTSGISPYAFPPVAAELAPLRPHWLFPPVVAGSDGVAGCPEPEARLTAQTPDGAPLCTRINRPEVPTIYPPVAQFWFAVVRGLVPREAAWWPLQLAGLLASLGVSAALIVGLRRRGLDERWAAVWAWSPFVAVEAVNNAHVDTLGVLFALAATFALAGRAGVRPRPWLGGVLLGLAAATKVVPLVVAPPLLRRSPLRVLTGAVVTVAAVYLPFVLVGGTDVLGYLPGYLAEERYSDGSRFVLIAALVPGPAATWVALAVLGVAAVLAWWRADADRPWHAQTVLAGVVLLVVNPLYAWYGLVLLPLVALSRRWEWLAVPLALSINTGVAPRPLVLGVAAAVVAAGSVLRLVRARRRRLKEGV